MLYPFSFMFTAFASELQERNRRLAQVIVEANIQASRPAMSFIYGGTGNVPIRDFALTGKR